MFDLVGASLNTADDNAAGIVHIIGDLRFP